MKIYLGVSGGIDSFASALILKEKGYEVIGVHLIMNGECKENIPLLEKKLDIPIIVSDVSNSFKNVVINNFVNTYLEGGTPSPCVVCNNHIKWQSLIEVADREGGGMVATGHYCRKIIIDDFFYIQQGVDKIKDQSYYLWGLTQKVLSRAYFPLGGMTKKDVRLFVKERGYDEEMKRKESMGICFMEGKTVQEYLSSSLNLSHLNDGNLVDEENNIIGKHLGYPFYTLAQKKLLPIKDGRCVIKIDKDTNTIVVGNRNKLYTKELTISDFYCCNTKIIYNNLEDIRIKVRGIGENPEGKCNFSEIKNNRLKITLESYAWAVTIGQPIVLYFKDIVVGGGVISL
ncbi:MAG: tRNA 2-thiouridine(34) synthase MnmA [Bacteroidetes bacterium]|nr:tRNA 2-thiouridine(34) synthase MnmA [Bacteroidota bacterium]